MLCGSGGLEAELEFRAPPKAPPVRLGALGRVHIKSPAATDAPSLRCRAASVSLVPPNAAIALDEPQQYRRPLARLEIVAQLSPGTEEEGVVGPELRLAVTLDATALRDPSIILGATPQSGGGELAWPLSSSTASFGVFGGDPSVEAAALRSLFRAPWRFASVAEALHPWRRLIASRDICVVIFDPLAVSASSPSLVPSPVGTDRGSPRCVVNLFLENRHPSMTIKVSSLKLHLDRSSPSTASYFADDVDDLSSGENAEQVSVAAERKGAVWEACIAAFPSATSANIESALAPSSGERAGLSRGEGVGFELNLSSILEATWVVHGIAETDGDGLSSCMPPRSFLPLSLAPGDVQAAVLAIDLVRGRATGPSDGGMSVDGFLPPRALRIAAAMSRTPLRQLRSLDSVNTDDGSGLHFLSPLAVHFTIEGSEKQEEAMRMEVQLVRWRLPLHVHLSGMTSNNSTSSEVPTVVHEVRIDLRLLGQTRAATAHDGSFADEDSALADEPLASSSVTSGAVVSCGSTFEVEALVTNLGDVGLPALVLVAPNSPQAPSAQLAGGNSDGSLATAVVSLDAEVFLPPLEPGGGEAAVVLRYIALATGIVRLEPIELFVATVDGGLGGEAREAQGDGKMKSEPRRQPIFSSVAAPLEVHVEGGL